MLAVSVCLDPDSRNPLEAGQKFNFKSFEINYIDACRNPLEAGQKFNCSCGKVFWTQLSRNPLEAGQKFNFSGRFPREYEQLSQSP